MMSHYEEIKLYGVSEPERSRVALQLQPNGEFEDHGLWLTCILFAYGNTIGTDAFLEFESLGKLGGAYNSSLYSGPADYELYDTDHAFDLALRFDTQSRRYDCTLALNFDWQVERPLVSVKVDSLRVEVEVVQRFVSKIGELAR